MKNEIIHSITICADSITPVDETLIPTGELMSVEVYTDQPGWASAVSRTLSKH